MDHKPVNEPHAGRDEPAPGAGEPYAAPRDRLLGELCDQVVAAGRRGQLDVVALLAAEIARRTGTDEEDEGATASPPAPVRATASSSAAGDLASRMAAREAGVRAAFARSFADAPADEQLLHELAAERAGLSVALRDAQVRVAVRLPGLLSDARTAKVGAALLRELLGADAAIAGRIESSLAVAATLRAQRRIARLRPAR